MVLAAAVSAVVVTGCGDSDEDDPANLAQPSKSPKSLDFFQSPTGNISCYMDSRTGVRCDIEKKSWTAPPKPASCKVDWGFGLTLNRGRGTFVCAGDTVSDPSAPVLAYGERSVRVPFTCISAEASIICTNTKTGHGFKLSRTSKVRF